MAQWIPDQSFYPSPKMAAVALVVFERLGVRMLRKAWCNVDLVWVATLIVTGLMTVLL